AGFSFPSLSLEQIVNLTCPIMGRAGDRAPTGGFDFIEGFAGLEATILGVRYVVPTLPPVVPPLPGDVPIFSIEAFFSLLANTDAILPPRSGAPLVLAAPFSMGPDRFLGEAAEDRGVSDWLFTMREAAACKGPLVGWASSGLTCLARYK